MDSDIKNLIRAGIVSAVFPERHTARVTYLDKDDVVSGELAIITSYSSQNKLYHLPDVGESVLCLLLPNSLESGEGFILGSFFNDTDKPNAASQNVFRLDFSDGAFVEYDRQSHKMTIQSAGEIHIKGTKIYLN